MKVNFFDQGCNSTTFAKAFGVCDDQNGAPAYLKEDLELADQWGCDIRNPRGLEVTLTAVDNCIHLFKNDDKDLESTCDAMLTYESDIDFLELKDKRDSWKMAGAYQIENTILLFSKYHDIKQFRRRRAFVANRSFPNFSHYETETKQRFWDGYRTRIYAQRTIEL